MDLTHYCWFARETFKKTPTAAKDLPSKSAKQYYDGIADAFALAQKYFTPEKGDLYLRIASHYTGINPLPKGTEKLLSQEARSNWRTRIGSQYSAHGLVAPIAWLATYQDIPAVRAYLESVEETIENTKASQTQGRYQGHDEAEIDKFTVAAVMWMRLEQQMSPPHKESLYRFPSSYTELVLKYATTFYSSYDSPLLQLYLGIDSSNSSKAREAITSLLLECMKSTQLLKETRVRNSPEMTDREKVERLEQLHRQRTVYR